MENMFNLKEDLLASFKEDIQKDKDISKVIEEVRLEVKSLQERIKELSWQPIETAPRDGAEVDLMCELGRCLDCSLIKDRFGILCWHNWQELGGYGWRVVPISGMGKALAWKRVEEFKGVDNDK